LDSIIATSHAPSPLRYVKSTPISVPCDVNFKADLEVATSEDEVVFSDGCFCVPWLGATAVEAELSRAFSVLFPGSVTLFEEPVQPTKIGK
jgi:hypothetical protein